MRVRNNYILIVPIVKTDLSTDKRKKNYLTPYILVKGNK